MERVEEIRKRIEECQKEVAELRERLVDAMKAGSALYIDLFYAENGMEVGQHFMYNGKEYARVETSSDVGRLYFRAYQEEVDDEGRWVMDAHIFPSDYGRIKPIPMEK